MMGQSAGASSIMHHIAAPYVISNFQTRGAIVQSAGFFPQPNSTQNDEMYAKFLELTGAKDADALWTADTKILQDANAKMVHDSKYGYFNFGPTIDGSYVTDLPGKVLAQPPDGLYMPALLVGHMKLDGLLFTPPWIRTTEALLDYVRELFPGVPQAVLDTIASEYEVPTNLGPQGSLLAVASFLDVGLLLTILCLNPLTRLYLGHRHPVQLGLPHRSFEQIKAKGLSSGIPIRLQRPACNPWL